MTFVEDGLKVIALKRNGLSLAEIASRTGKSTAWVRAMLKIAHTTEMLKDLKEELDRESSSGEFNSSPYRSDEDLLEYRKQRDRDVPLFNKNTKDWKEHE